MNNLNSIVKIKKEETSYLCVEVKVNGEIYYIPMTIFAKHAIKKEDIDE